MSIENAIILFCSSVLIALVVLYYVDSFLNESRRKTQIFRDMASGFYRMELTNDVALDLQKEMLNVNKQRVSFQEELYLMHRQKHDVWAMKNAEALKKRMEELRRKMAQFYPGHNAGGPDEEGAPLV